MGSFSTTCFVTNQTIAEKDKCRVIPIGQCSTFNPVQLTVGDKSFEQMGIANSNCYPDCFWQPESGFIAGEYNDMGQFKLKIDPIVRAKLLTFYGDVLVCSAKTESGGNSSQNMAFDFAQFLAENTPRLKAALGEKRMFSATATIELDQLDDEIEKCWDYIAQAVSQNRLFMRVNGYVRPVQFAVMHERTYESLIADSNARTNWSDEPMEQKAVIQRALSTATQEADEYFTKHKTDEDASSTRRYFFIEGFRIAVQRLGSESGVDKWVEGATLRDLCCHYLDKKLTQSGFIERCVAVLNDRYAASALDAWNIKYSPMVASRQDDSNRMGQGYAKFVSAVSKKITQDRKVDRYGEYFPYTMNVSNQVELDVLSKFMNENDSDIDVLSVAPALLSPQSDLPVGALEVTFCCPDKMKGLQRLIGEFSGGDLMARTLIATSEEAPAYPRMNGA